MAGSFIPVDSAMHEGKLRLSRLLVYEGQHVLRNLLDAYHCPPSIDCSDCSVNTLSREQHSSLEFDNVYQFHSREQPYSQRLRCLFADHSREQHSSLGFDIFFRGNSREQRSSEEIDITNIFTILRKECGLHPPPTGWDALPHDDDLSLSADIARIKWYRNEIAHESEKGAKLTDEEYNCFKEKIVSSLKRIVQDYSGTNFEAVYAWEKRVQECLSSPVTKEDERNVEELKAWYLKDVEEEQQEFSETDNWYGGVKGESLLTVENDEKHYGAGSIRDLKDVEEEQQESSETDNWYGGVKGVSGLTVENGEKHYGAGSIRDLKDVEEEQQESGETEKLDCATKEAFYIKNKNKTEKKEKIFYHESKVEKEPLPQRNEQLTTEQWDDTDMTVPGTMNENEEEKLCTEPKGEGETVKEEPPLQTNESVNTEQWDDADMTVPGTMNENEEEKLCTEPKGDGETVKQHPLQTSESVTTEQWDDTDMTVPGTMNENEEEKLCTEPKGDGETVKEEPPLQTSQSGDCLLFSAKSISHMFPIGSPNFWSVHRLSTGVFCLFHWKRSTSQNCDLTKYYNAQGKKHVDSGHYSRASTDFTNALDSLPSENDVLLKASLQNNIGCALLLGNKNEKAKMALNQVIQTMNCATPTVKDNHFIDKAKSILFVSKNNHACVELENGNFEEALSTYKKLYEEEKGELVRDDKLERKILPRVPVENEESCLSPNNRSTKLLNLVIVAMNYSQACLLSGKLENIVEVLQEVIQICQTCQLQLVVSARLARIFTILGMKKQVKELVELHDIDCLKLQKIIESDSLKPFSVIYTNDICRLLAYNGERSKARELLETAVRVCQEMHSKQHPTVISLEKTKDELFPTLVMEKACLPMEEDNILRLRVVTNVVVEYALQVLSNDSDRARLLSELSALKSLSSDEKSFADVYTSEKQPALSIANPTVAFISTLCWCAFLLQHVKSGSKAESYLQNQLGKIESFYDELEENAVSRSGMSLLSDDESCCISSLCFLLETALAQHAHASVDDICTSLVSSLSRGHSEDLNEVEYWYKNYCGLLSYFVATNNVQISGNKIPLYVIVASGSGLKTPADVGHLSEEKAFFNKIALSTAESEECSSNTPGANAKCFVFLRSQDLVDIGDVRRINNTIVQSFQSLESSSINVSYQRSLFIEVGPEIDPSSLSALCLQLNSLKCCLESSGVDRYGPVNEPSAQHLYLQKLQKPLTFEDELDLDVFMALCQYTFCNLKIVDVQYKARKKMVCLMKEPPFSVLTLHIKENTLYLTIQDVGDKCFHDGNRGNYTTQLIDDTIAECLEKLGISSTNDPRDVWRTPSAEQTDDIPVFCAEEEDELERAFKTNARLTAELKYLKSKQEKQTSRIKKLNDILSEVELRVGLLQNFAHFIFSDVDKMKTVENWITRKRTRQEDPREEPSNEARYEVEEILGSMANDELAELLAEIQRLDPMLQEDEASGSSREVSSNESTQDYSSLSIAAEVTESPVLIEGYTQTDSLSSFQEHKDKVVQTDPVQQTNVLTLENVGLADFKRDRAERQLRKSRLSQDVLAFKNRPRESLVSLQGSIVTEKSRSLSEGITPESLPEPCNSKASITSQESSRGTEGVLSEGTPLDSTSFGSSEQFPSQCSIISQESSHGRETPPSSVTSSSLRDSWTSKSSVCSEAASHGTEDVTSEGMPPDSIFRDSSTQQYLSKGFVVIEASSNSAEETSSKETPRKSTTCGSSLEQLPNNHPIVGKEESQGTESIPIEGTPQDPVKSHVLSKHVTEASVASSTSGSKQSIDDSFSGYSSLKGTNRVVLVNEMPDLTVPYVRTPPGITQEPGNAHLEKKESDDAILCGKKYLGIARESGDKEAEMNAYTMLGKARSKKREYNDATSYSKRCLVIPRECGDKDAEMKAYLTLGNAHLEKEEYDDAILYSERSLAIAQECGDKEAETNAYRMLGKAHSKKREYDDAILHCMKYLANTQKMGEKKPVTNRKRSTRVMLLGMAGQEALNRPFAASFVLPQTDNEGEQDSRCLGNHNIDDLTPDRVSSSVEAKCKSRRTEFERGGVDKQRTHKYHRHKEFYCVHKGGEGDKPSKGSSVSSEANIRDDERTQFLEYAESDGGEHTSLNTKKIDFSSDVSSKTPDEISTHDVTSREQVRDDVRTHDQRNKCDVHCTTNHSLGTSNVAASYASHTVLGNFGSSNGKTHDECDKSVTQCITGEDTLQYNENCLEGQLMSRCHVQSNVKRKTNNKDTELNGDNVGTTVGNGQCMSLPHTRVIQGDSNEEKRSGRIAPLPPHLQQGDQNEACLSTIKETDDTRDADTVWSSQGARPKRISPLHADNDDDDFIVTGVETSFLSRHSRDSSLTQFLSLPAFPERAEVPSIARTWPPDNKRWLPGQKDVLDDKSKPPYQGLPLETRKENVIFQDRDIIPCKQQKEVPIPGSQTDVATGRLPLPGSQTDVATCRLPLPGSQTDVATCRLPLPGSQTDVAKFRLPLPGSQTDVVTGRLPLPGSQTDAATGTGSSHFKSKNSSNLIVDFSPTRNTNSLSDDDDSYKTADDSFSSLDSLEDQVKRSKMTWSQMSASTMFGPDKDHDDDDDNDDVEDEEKENRCNEMQSENRREEEKNLERTEGKARKTDLGGATSSSTREDFARRDQRDAMTTSQSSAEQVTPLTVHRVLADVIDAKERELRLEREREREERRKREEEEIKRCLETSQRAREQSPPSTPQPARLPVQESASEWPCSHYKRRCAIKFPCCEEFYYCHRCHNNSDLCPKDDKKALHGTHLRCLVCLTEQEITENSQYCIHCKTKLAEYFCGICKHFTGNEKKPYHCEPCGICRIHSDRSFHCKVCNVCLDERLRNNHICRPDSGHDECCICLEDAFGGCQILPCSHKVHRDCAIAMLQNGVRKCPVCRHPLNQSMQRGQRS